MSTLNLWLLGWLLSARSFLDLGAGESLDAAREHIRGQEYWVLRDPARPTVPFREARERGAIGYRVLIEVGLEAELPTWVRTVGAVLDDPRGWKAAGRELVRVDARERFVVLLARPQTVDRLCRPLRTVGKYSCGRAGRASLNLTRWREGAAPWGEEIEGYRVYMINHEVGHLLGMPHQRCEGEGEPAAVMVQQTMGLGGCEPSGWPAARELERLGARWNRLFGSEDSG
ncbi:DUF3152 domain-containing protein [Enhygromyxa salina]|nr:DUF3152 domain-containing protein [Enhygromyxa salina]